MEDTVSAGQDSGSPPPKRWSIFHQEIVIPTQGIFKNDIDRSIRNKFYNLHYLFVNIHSYG